MLYISGVNQPKLTTGRQPVTSRGKGNPMKANARQEPGSTPSRRTGLSRSAPPPRRFQIIPETSVQNLYKSEHFRECEFFNGSATTTYNFTAIKCTDFPGRPKVGTSLRRCPPFGGASSVEPLIERCPFSLGEKVRMRDKPVPLCVRISRGNFLYNYCTKLMVADEN